MYSSIVVGIDGSDHALDAVRRAGELAKHAESGTVHIVYAVSPQADYVVRAVAEEGGIDSEAAAPGSTVDRHVAAAKKELADVGVAVTTRIQGGRPSGVILDLADEVDADLIVVGARGLGPVGRFVRGSVSTRVAHHATCDVLIVEHAD